ncbi:MAG TPA: cupredoxin family copper-binding protein [Anaerovoracaceae bacterium]|nr:cupredoxin family copper-binding protein [Anaerovoracaceae bacterium]
MNRTRQLFISLLIVTLIIGISGCGAAKNEAPSTPAPDKNTVIIENYKFQPAEITIKSGDTITWINKDSMKHTATGDSFDSGLLGKDESFQQQFDEIGTFDYHCTPHPYMKGKVIVE